VNLFIAFTVAVTITCAVAGCASSDIDVSSTAPRSQSEGMVPGEKVYEDTQLAPGSGANPNASVRW
jgi:hypothetical protein